MAFGNFFDRYNFRSTGSIVRHCGSCRWASPIGSCGEISHYWCSHPELEGSCIGCGVEIGKDVEVCDAWEGKTCSSCYWRRLDNDESGKNEHCCSHPRRWSSVLPDEKTCDFWKLVEENENED